MADQTTPSTYSYLQTMPANMTFHDGCTKDNVIFIDGDRLPEDDHHGVVTSDVQVLLRRIKDIVLVILFLIGGPANVINMAVFYKQGLKDRVNLCLFALSLADELHLIMTMFHHGEQLHLQFTTKEKFGPIDTFLANNNLMGLMGFNYISYIMSAIIACERCFCVLWPLKFQTLLRTRTMGIIISAAYLLVLSLYFVMATRYRKACVYNPVSKEVVKIGVTGEFYKAHKELIDNLESFVFGVGVPGVVVMTVIATTKLTTMKLREIVTWRAGTSSSISAREVALVRMLVGNSILFLVCIFPVAVLRLSWLILPGMNMGTENSNLFLVTMWVTEVFTFINASLNIFVYYAMGSRYRETLWTLLGRQVEMEKE